MTDTSATPAPTPMAYKLTAFVLPPPQHTVNATKSAFFDLWSLCSIMMPLIAVWDNADEYDECTNTTMCTPPAQCQPTSMKNMPMPTPLSMINRPLLVQMPTTQNDKHANTSTTPA
jgi:hypothetical protein